MLFQTSTMETFGARLRLLRETRGWPQERLAFEVGVTGATVSKWENNRAEPNLSHLTRLRQMFAGDGATLDWLIDTDVAAKTISESRAKVMEPGREYAHSVHAVESEQELLLLSRFRRLSAKRRKAAVDLLDDTRD